MHVRRLLWALPAVALSTCATQTEGEQLDASPGYVIRGELPPGVSVEDVLAQIPSGGFGIVGHPTTGEVAMIVPTSPDASANVSSHFSVTAGPACPDCGISCQDTMARTIEIGLTQGSGPDATPLRVQTHASMNFSSPAHSPSSWISAVGSDVTISTVGMLSTCATFSYYFDIATCGPEDECVACNPDDTREIECGLNGRGTRPQACVDGAWEDDGPCEDPDECVDGSEISTDSCDWVCVDGSWSGCAFVEVTGNGFHNCALRETGSVECWGANWFGQLGNGTTDHSNVPVRVLDLDDAVTVSAGTSHTCAVRETGGVVCWGRNAEGQLGDQSLTQSTVPVPVVDLDDAVALSMALFRSHAVRTTGALVRWGPDVTEPFPQLTQIGLVSDSGYHTCAMTIFGVISCWGANWAGQLGNGSTQDSASPVTLPLEPNVYTGVSAGGSHTCAPRLMGDVRCWGLNEFGQLGTGSFVNSTTPAPVANLGDAVVVSTGSNHTCAVRETGEVVCWGQNEWGQLGNGSLEDSNVPLPASNLDDAVAVSTGSRHSCAVRETGRIVCWGENEWGQLGNGSNSDSSVPVPVHDEP